MEIKVEKFNKEDLLWEIDALLEMRGFRADVKKLKSFIKKNVKKEKNNV